MGSILAAWLVGEGIVFYRTWKATGGPPLPGQLLATTGLFAVLALVAESGNARPLAQVTAWGFDIAAFLNVVPVTPEKPKESGPPSGEGNTPTRTA